MTMSLLVGGSFIGITIHGSRSVAIFTTMIVVLIAFQIFITMTVAVGADAIAVAVAIAVN